MVTGQGDPGGPRMIKASEFKAKCLKLMDEVAENGEEIVITKNGKPVAKLTAFRERPTSFFGADQERYPFLKDVIEALDRGEGADVVWEAETRLDRRETMLIMDTHTLVWLRYGDSQLGNDARRESELAWRNYDAAVSAFTFWEVAMLRVKDRLDFSGRC